jgi:hypothetical protein
MNEDRLTNFHVLSLECTRQALLGRPEDGKRVCDKIRGSYAQTDLCP